MHSIAESENKDAESIFYSREFFENERGEIWIKCFSCSLWAHVECTGAENKDISVTFINRLEVEIVFA